MELDLNLAPPKRKSKKCGDDSVRVILCRTNQEGQFAWSGFSRLENLWKGFPSVSDEETLLTRTFKGFRKRTRKISEMRFWCSSTYPVLKHCVVVIKCLRVRRLWVQIPALLTSHWDLQIESPAQWSDVTNNCGVFNIWKLWILYRDLYPGHCYWLH